MEYLITYDVETESQAGRKRLRRVAKICEAYGQRVQKSVFECRLNAVQMEQLRHKLLAEIDPKMDSLRIYRLIEPKDKYLEVYGIKPIFDLNNPIVL